MKTTTTILFSLMLFTLKSFSQGLYVGGSIGYASPFLNQLTTVDQASSSYNSSSSYTSNTSVDGKYSNFGSGSTIGFIIGYAFKSNVAIDFGYNNFYTSDVTGSFQSNNYNNGILTTTQTSSMILSSTHSQFTTGIKYTLPMSKGAPYFRAGILFGFSSIKTHTTSYYNDLTTPGSAYNTLDETKYTGPVSIGLYSAVGYKININPSLSLFAEVFLNANRFKPAEAEVTKSTKDGIDQLSSMTTQQKKTEFSESYTNSSSSDPNSPNKSLAQTYSFTSVGIQVGIIYQFAKK